MRGTPSAFGGQKQNKQTGGCGPGFFVSLEEWLQFRGLCKIGRTWDYFAIDNLFLRVGKGGWLGGLGSISLVLLHFLEISIDL